jgi:protein BCP1
LIGNYPLKFVQ